MEAIPLGLLFETPAGYFPNGLSADQLGYNAILAEMIVSAVASHPALAHAKPITCPQHSRQFITWNQMMFHEISNSSGDKDPKSRGLCPSNFMISNCFALRLPFGFTRAMFDHEMSRIVGVIVNEFLSWQKIVMIGQNDMRIAMTDDSIVGIFTLFYL
jgi:hypothetical protein